MTSIQDSFFAILTQCDGAHSRDTVGFNAADAAPARRLARRANSDTWGAHEDYIAWLMLAKYATQLQREHGIDYTAIPAPPKPERGGSSRYVCRVADKPILRFAFEYGERQFDSIKRQVKEGLGARWNPTQKVWELEYSQKTRDGILALIDDYDFELSPGAIELLATEPGIVEPPKPVRTITANGKQFLVRWGKSDPNFTDIKNAVAALRGRKWNPDKMAWECFSSLDLLAICEKYGFDGADTLRQALDSRAASVVTALTPEQEMRLTEITPKLLPFQVAAVQSQAIAIQNGGTLDASDTGCHAKGTMILMFDGSVKKVEEIIVGDKIMGWDSTPRRVLSLARGREAMAKIVPVKGEPFIVNQSHILTLVRTNETRSPDLRGLVVDVRVSDYLNWNKREKHLYKLFRVGVNCFPEAVLPISPYHLGVLIGDGCLVSQGALAICKPDNEIRIAASELAFAHGAVVKESKYKNRVATYHIRQSTTLWAALHALGLAELKSKDKFIPSQYLTSSWEQRSQMLAGLLDTDGHSTSGGYDYISASERLSNGVAFLARSLGLAAYCKPSEKYCQTGAGGTYWRVSISGDCSKLPLRIAHKKPSERTQKKSVMRTGFSVELLPEDDFYGFSIDGDGRFLLGDFTVTHNTGKTFIALAVCAVLNRPAYVVAPKAVIPSWQRAADHFGVRLAGIKNYELLTRGQQPELSKSGEERVSFQWHLPAETVIIIDECHRMKDGKTLNNKMGMAALKQGYATFGLSATAADNPMQMKFTGTLTGIFEDGQHWNWALENGVYNSGYGYKFNGDREILAKIHKQIFPKRGNRIRIKDLGDAFPESQIAAEAYGVNGAEKEIEKVYKEMRAELKRLATKETEDGDPLPITIRLRARQRVELLKVPAIVEMAEDAVESGMSVAIFVNFNETVDTLCEKLKTRCVIRGGQSDADREANIAAFQADTEPIIIANIKAGGVGVSLHGTPESRTRLSIISPSDSGQDLKQCLGRVWRANGAKSIQRIFFAAGTVEEKVCANVRAKIARIDTINEGDLDTDAEF